MSSHDPAHPGPQSPRWAAVRRFGPLLLVVGAFLVLRAVTYSDGAEGIVVGRCVTASTGDDVRTVDCEDPASLGRVVVVQRNVLTDDESVRRLCAEHGSSRAFTSAQARDGTGTVVCARPAP